MTMLEYAAPPATDLLSDLGRRIIGAEDADTLRENANLNGDSFSGKMSRLGSETAKWHAMRHVLPAALAEAVESGDLYVHDLDQYALGTTNCIFIPFDRSLASGFNTGNGSVRTPRRLCLRWHWSRSSSNPSKIVSTAAFLPTK